MIRNGDGYGASIDRAFHYHMRSTLTVKAKAIRFQYGTHLLAGEYLSLWH